MSKQLIITSFIAFFSGFSSLFGQLFPNDVFTISENIGSGPYTIHVSDYNLDGSNDLIVKSSLGLKLFNQVNSTSFFESSIASLNNIQIENFATGDLDNDNGSDLVFISAMNELIIGFNNGNGDFPEQITLELPNSSHTLLDEIVLRDLNSDGNLDILTATSSSELSLFIHLNNGDGTFSSPKVLSNFRPNAGTTYNRLDHLYIQDFNSDNIFDILIVVDGFPTFLFNNGICEFQYDYARLTTLTRSEAFFVDFDSDGDIDFHAESTVRWIETVAPLQDIEHTLSIPSQFNSNIEHSVVSDFDLDGDQDIIFGSSDKLNPISIMNNDGFGNFNHSTINETLHQISEFRNFDIDNNGSEDLIFFDFNDITNETSLVWYVNLADFDSVSGCAYHDENSNGKKDLLERPIGNILVKIDSENAVYPANNDDCYAFFLDNGTYELIYQPSPLWNLSSDSSSYTFTIDDNSRSDLNFGFFPSDTIIRGIMHSTSGIVRCNRDVKFSFSFQNTGATTITEGILWVVPDSLTVIATEIEAIDTILFDGTYGWKFQNLYPGETVTRSILLKIPGLGGDIEPGTLIEFLSSAEVYNGIGVQNFFKHNFSEEIRCAYDPNDKLISPMREEEENYTLFGDTLVYTVRFQNTGNDTAFNVVIRDTLDQNLEVGTFNIIHSSHRAELTTDIQGGRNVTFNFENILLPDSTIDFIGSQGYVTYAIEAKDPIPENTEILNTASIYFDFNPPIVTNTTLNTLVSCYPIEEQFISVSINEGEVYNLPDGTAVSQTGTYEVAIEDEEGCPIEYYIISLEVLTSTNDLKLQSAISIAPNPVHDDFILTLDIDGEIDLLGTISDPFDKKITTASIISNNTKFDTHQLTSGVYFLQIHTKGGELIAVKKFVVIN